MKRLAAVTLALALFTQGDLVHGAPKKKVSRARGPVSMDIDFGDSRTTGRLVIGPDGSLRFVAGNDVASLRLEIDEEDGLRLRGHAPDTEASLVVDPSGFAVLRAEGPEGEAFLDVEDGEVRFLAYDGTQRATLLAGERGAKLETTGPSGRLSVDLAEAGDGPAAPAGSAAAARGVLRVKSDRPGEEVTADLSFVGKIVRQLSAILEGLLGE